MFVVKRASLWIQISLGVIVIAIAAIAIKGVSLGVEFTGGSLFEIQGDSLTVDSVRDSLSEAGFSAEIQSFGEGGVLVRTKEVAQDEKEAMISVLKEVDDTAIVSRETSIGPSIGKELQSKAFIALIIVALAIILFVAYAFRKGTYPVSSWRFGFAAVLALLHDIIIPTGLYVWLGREIDPLYVVGALSILGLSVNDTIVVFDRIREKLGGVSNPDALTFKEFRKLVGESLASTVTRSINTSLTLIVVLVALLAFGPESTTNLILILLFGTIAGTYSSIFFASPILLLMQKRAMAKKK